METVARACGELRADLGATRSEHIKHPQAPQYTLLAFGGWDTWTCVCCKGNCERKNEEAQLEPNAQLVLHYWDPTDGIVTFTRVLRGSAGWFDLAS